ncbi:hypothetical protein AOQ73_21250 [Bradyrhizobium pachyrhizi]|nr:hypothetical protein AOQ73_21250 [Bradyrhizobium pachyrhizi]
MDLTRIIFDHSEDRGSEPGLAFEQTGHLASWRPGASIASCEALRAPDSLIGLVTIDKLLGALGVLRAVAARGGRAIGLRQRQQPTFSPDRMRRHAIGRK